MFMLVINIKHCGNPSASVAVQTTSTKKYGPKLLQTALMEFSNKSCRWWLSVARVSVHAYV